MFDDFKKLLLERIMGYFGAPLSGLLFAMFFGDDVALLPSVSHYFEIIGMQHIMVASGYNVGMILAMGKIVLGRFWGFGKALCLVALLLTYVFMAGASPSLIRATLQASIMLFGAAVGKVRVPAFWALCTMFIFVTLFWSELWGEVSFQLSVLSTVSVLLADTLFPLGEFAKGHWVRNFFIETAQLTIVVQLVTFPVIWYYFGSVSLLTLPANTLLLWLTPFLTYLAMIAVTVAMFQILIPSELFGMPVAMMLNVVGWVLGESFISVAKFLSQWESSVVSLPPFNLSYAVCWYGLLFSYVCKIWWGSKKIYQGVL